MNDEPITLYPGQQHVMDQLVTFLDSHDKVFVLKGYAGTGKTTMMRELVRYLREKERGFHLLATTGRAATILDKATGGGGNAATIHSMIYRYKNFNQDISKIDEKHAEVNGQLYLVFEAVKADADDKRQVYIIDEASMISDTPTANVSQAAFGSGRLLKELLEYDSDPECKYIFVGDPCQLPPIDGSFSPALTPEYIRQTFGVGVQEGQLTQIIRQGNGNSIIDASQRIRQMYARAPESEAAYGQGRTWGKMPIMASTNIQLHASQPDLLDSYISSVKANGYGYCTFVCRSNSDCYNTALEVRRRLGKYGSLAQQDLLLVIQNNQPSGLYNGDLVVVEEFEGTVQHRAGLTFRRVKVREISSDTQRDTLLIEEVLHSGKLNLDSEQQKALFVDFVLRMKARGVKPKDAEVFNRAMMTDPYLNALRCTFGYAMTCHKTQGGEWPEVFVKMPRNIMLNPTKNSFQWVYTAITRAKDKLHIVNDIYLQNFNRWN